MLLFTPYLCSYRTVYNTQQTFSAHIEKWKKNMDGNVFEDATLMNLSKVFVTLSYGFQYDALKLFHS